MRERAFWTYAKIILPLIKPSLVVVIVFTVLGTWNDFMGAADYFIQPREIHSFLGYAAIYRKCGQQLWGGYGGRAHDDAAGGAALYGVPKIFYQRHGYERTKGIKESLNEITNETV